MELLYDVKAVAVMLAISPWTVRAYIRNGKLQPVRLGRLVRIDAASIQSFIDANKAKRKSMGTPSGEGESQ